MREQRVVTRRDSRGQLLLMASGIDQLKGEDLPGSTRLYRYYL